MTVAFQSTVHGTVLATELLGATVAKPKKLWKVGEVVRHSGLTRQSIHNYVLLGLIEEAEVLPSGHRLFDESVFARLRRIEALKRKGLRLTEIAARLRRTRTTTTGDHPAGGGSKGGERADEQG